MQRRRTSRSADGCPEPVSVYVTIRIPLNSTHGPRNFLEKLRAFRDSGHCHDQQNPVRCLHHHQPRHASSHGILPADDRQYAVGRIRPAHRLDHADPAEPVYVVLEVQPHSSRAQRPERYLLNSSSGQQVAVIRSSRCSKSCAAGVNHPGQFPRSPSRSTCCRRRLGTGGPFSRPKDNSANRLLSRPVPGMRRRSSHRCQARRCDAAALSSSYIFWVCCIEEHDSSITILSTLRPLVSARY